MIYIYIYSLHLFYNIYCTIWVVTVLSFELVFFIWQLIMKWWFSYLEKLVRKLFNCCHVACEEKKQGKKKKIWINFLVSYRGKRNRTKASRYKLLGLAVCLLLYFWNYLFFYLFVFIQYLLIYLSVYLCIYLFHRLLCTFAWFWYREGGVSEQKGTKRLVERLRQ